MQAQTRLTAAIAAAAAAFALAMPTLASAAPAAQAAQPCLSATEACVRWTPLGPSGARAMVYATHSLIRRDPHIRRALIMVHGTLRNADHYFTTATGAAFLAKALGDTI